MARAKSPGTLRRGRLTHLGSQVVAAGILLCGLSFAGSAPALTLLGIALLTGPVIAILTPTQLGSLVVEAITAAAETPLGETAAISLVLSARSARTIRRFRLEWGGGVWTSGATTVADLPAGTRTTVTIELQALRHAEVDTIYLTVADTGALGLAVRSAEVRVRLPRPILLTPRVVAVPTSTPPSVPGWEDEGSSSVTRAATSGSYPRGSRPFRAGDEPRSVAWRATARSGRLTVREWDPPQRPAPLALAVLLPHVRGPLLPGRPVDADDVAAESLLSALASLGVAAGLDGRPLSVTRAMAVPPNALGAGPAPATVHTVPGLDGQGVVRELARVPEVLVAPLSYLAAEAAQAAALASGGAAHAARGGTGGTVLLGVNLAGASWLPEAFLSCVTAVEQEGCTLEVVVSHPGGPLPASTQAALDQLGIHCKVFRASEVLAA